MEFIHYEATDQTAVLTLARGKANAINSDMLDELTRAVARAEEDESIRGLVIASDRPRFFSTGFDVNEVFEYDRQRMGEFFGRFIDLYEKIIRLPKPVIAAVAGHAFAGGAILALVCDARVFAEGDFVYALNEINLGFVLPSGLIRAAIDAVGVGHARQLLLGGETISPTEAARIGLAREVVAAESVLDRAKEYARRLGEKPASAFSAIKRSFVEATGRTASDRLRLEEFLDHWFSKEAEEGKRALIESLKK
jgi:enoyl-CoA hydratase/carnithine racemase